jgi:uncharacterized OB-fold protein
MAHPSVHRSAPQPRNATAGRKLAAMYSKQFGRKCEDCGEDSFQRRTRCKRCGLLVCGWCFHHVHSIPMGGFSPPACAA